MEVKAFEQISVKTLVVVGAPETTVVSLPSHPEKAPMAFGTMHTRYCMAFFLPVNEVGDICWHV
jgi:hypothetical protein